MKRTFGTLLAIGLACVSGNAEADSGHARATVHIKNFAFVTTPLAIGRGERVTFVNDDDEAHTITSTVKGAFDSAGLDSGATWEHTFERAGTYSYYCELHPYMKGTIVVTDAPSRATA